jgi:hypothetical protein
LQEKGLRVIPPAAAIRTQGDHGATFGAVRHRSERVRDG